MTTPIDNESDERRDILRRIWLAQARALAAILEGTPPGELQAATLQVARAFLADNHTDVNELNGPEELRRSTASLLKHIPEFDDP